MISKKEDPFLDINDDLEGVDDFMNEQNPFEGTHDSAFSPDFDTKLTQTSPPVYDDVLVDENLESRGNQDNATSTRNLNAGPVKELPPGLINYYSRFFQLSTEAFKDKFLKSLKLNQSIFTSETYDENDRELFGAIWITSAIVLVKFMIPGLINLIYYGIIKGVKINDSVTSSDRDKIYWNLIHSIWLFGIYTFVVPFIVLQIILKDDANNAEEPNQTDAESVGHLTINPNVKNLVGLITVYGYGNSIWLFILPVLDVLNRMSGFNTVVAVEWGIIALAYLKTAQYMHMQICNRGNGHSRLPFSMIFILGFHIIFSVLLMFILY